MSRGCDAGAPEFRRDPVTGRWVVVAPERSLRPMALDHSEPLHRDAGGAVPCPFCPGQEHDTPDEVLALRDESGAWRLRVVPNKFPAVRETSPPVATGGLELFQRLPASGRHEVVIETPDHGASPATLSDVQFRAVFRAYRERLLAHAADPSLEYAAVFKNVGAEAGASIGHTHSQIIATPLVPDSIRLELDRSAAYFADHDRCVFCDLIAAERTAGERVVAESDRMIAFAAYAPRFAYETWVLPKAHASRYEPAGDDLLAELADVMKRVVTALDRMLAFPAYNWFLHTAPLRSAELPHYHWHFEVMPRTARPAGFEWSTGCFVTAVSPERAAAELRAVV
jgi:UDPglucose--hexose-1-phosphate uridylyltransferase